MLGDDHKSYISKLTFTIMSKEFDPKKLKDPNKSKNNPFRTVKLQEETPNGNEAFRVQIPSKIVEEAGKDSRFYVGMGDDGVIQLHKSGTGLPNPMDDNLPKPKKLKKDDFLSNL